MASKLGHRPNAREEGEGSKNKNKTNPRRLPWRWQVGGFFFFFLFWFWGENEEVKTGLDYKILGDKSPGGRVAGLSFAVDLFF